MTSRQQRFLVLGLIALPLLALTLQVAVVVENWRWYQYDFRAYYTGPALYAAGQDPYSLEAHLELARELGLGQQRLSFVYSPTMLQLLSPLAWLPYPVIYGLWLGIQVLALAVVVVLSVRVLQIPWPIMLWVTAFGLNGAVAAVIRSGQMTLMVLALLLLGLWALSRNRWRGATVLMTLAAIPKVWVLPLLSVVAVPLALPRLLWLAGGVALCLGIGLSGRFLFPELQARYEEIVANFVDFSAGPAGPYNGTVVNFLVSLEELGRLPQGSGATIWMGIAVLVLVVSAVRCLTLPPGSHARIFAIAALGLCLFAPRMILYQWTIAIPAMAYALSRIDRRSLRLAALSVVLLPTLYVNRYLLDVNIDAPVEGVLLLIWSFSNYLIVLAGWIFCLTMRPEPMPDNRQNLR